MDAPEPQLRAERDGVDEDDGDGGEPAAVRCHNPRGGRDMTPAVRLGRGCGHAATGPPWRTWSSGGIMNGASDGACPFVDGYPVDGF